MAFDEGVAQRIREVLEGRPDIVEKKMFSGLAFMQAGHMCCGIVGETLMARVGPDAYDSALDFPHVRPMDFTGKPLKGFVYVEPDGFLEDDELRAWVDQCLTFTSTLPPK